MDTEIRIDLIGYDSKTCRNIYTIVIPKSKITEWNKFPGSVSFPISIFVTPEIINQEH